MNTVKTNYFSLITHVLGVMGTVGFASIVTHVQAGMTVKDAVVTSLGAVAIAGLGAAKAFYKDPASRKLPTDVVVPTLPTTGEAKIDG